MSYRKNKDTININILKGYKMDKLIIGNWKMNGSQSLVDAFLDSIEEQNVAIAFPDIFLAYAYLRNPKFKLATQNCSVYNKFGAHTGEISADMLANSGCRYVIIGHSERRCEFQEDSTKNILKKLNNVVSNNMIPVLCVDEKYGQLIDQETSDFIKNNANNLILAYEPLSAIGTGKTPGISEISDMLELLKKNYHNVKVLYGGSVNAQNIKEILSISLLDGVLVGGASLKLGEFKEIIAVSKI